MIGVDGESCRWRCINKWHGRVFVDVHSTPVLPVTERISMILYIISVMLSVQIPCTSPKPGSNFVLGNTSFVPYFI